VAGYRGPGACAGPLQVVHDAAMTSMDRISQSSLLTSASVPRMENSTLATGKVRPETFQLELQVELRSLLDLCRRRSLERHLLQHGGRIRRRSRSGSSALCIRLAWFPPSTEFPFLSTGAKPSRGSPGIGSARAAGICMEKWSGLVASSGPLLLTRNSGLPILSY